MNFQDKISKICPSATFEEGENLLVRVPDKDWHKLAVALHDDKDLDFDVLSAVVGMDWTETLGCLYYLTSTSHDWAVICVRVETDNLEQPRLHSVSDIWRVANFQEREVYDFFGI
jgi:NADH-quinone oxidoreductase subunit C/D